MNKVPAFFKREIDVSVGTVVLGQIQSSAPVKTEVGELCEPWPLVQTKEESAPVKQEYGLFVLSRTNPVKRELDDSAAISESEEGGEQERSIGLDGKNAEVEDGKKGRQYGKRKREESDDEDVVTHRYRPACVVEVVDKWNQWGMYRNSLQWVDPDAGALGPKWEGPWEGAAARFGVEIVTLEVWQSWAEVRGKQGSERSEILEKARKIENKKQEEKQQEKNKARKMENKKKQEEYRIANEKRKEAKKIAEETEGKPWKGKRREVMDNVEGRMREVAVVKKRQKRNARKKKKKQEEATKKAAQVTERKQMAEIARVAKVAQMQEEVQLAERAKVAKLARVKQEAQVAKVAQVKEEAQVAKGALVTIGAKLLKVAQVKKEAHEREEAQVKHEAHAAKEAWVIKEAQLTKEAQVKKEAQAAKESQILRRAEYLRREEEQLQEEEKKRVCETRKSRMRASSSSRINRSPSPILVNPSGKISPAGTNRSPPSKWRAWEKREREEKDREWKEEREEKQEGRKWRVEEMHLRSPSSSSRTHRSLHQKPFPSDIQPSTSKRPSENTRPYSHGVAEVVAQGVEMLKEFEREKSRKEVKRSTEVKRSKSKTSTSPRAHRSN